MNIKMYVVSTAERRQYTIFKFDCTDINSPIWCVCQTKWRIWHYDWSDRLSIKLPVKGAKMPGHRVGEL